uniref:Uncharacterized protein n=1 Tax=Noctiluca scintillans TaxID=2966 RepID=A0A7S1B076_NOCSC
MLSETVASLFDIRAAVEHAVREIRTVEELRDTETWIRSLHSEVLARLAIDDSTLLDSDTNAPGTLEEWYADPCDIRERERPRSASHFRKDRGPESVEMFSIEQLDDCHTEFDADQSREHVHDSGSDPHWQYGKCVAGKLVSISPFGSSAYEQLLVVLMTLFDLTEAQQQVALGERRMSKRWWPT